MNKIKTVLTAVTVFAATVCYAADSPSALGVTFKNGSFVITSPYLKGPLMIASGDLPICYETGGQKYYLRGNPSAATTGGDTSQFIWSVDDGKEITVGFTADNDSYKIDFEAEPSAEKVKWTFSLKAADDEYFTGLMERTIDGKQQLSWEPGIKEAMNLRGQTVTMLVEPSISLYCPFYISSRNYSLFVEGTWPGLYDFCKSKPDAVEISFEGPSLSLVLNTAANPAELVKAHSLDVGPTIVPPKWVFSTWRWRNNHTNRKQYYDGTAVTAPYNSELVEDILMMEAFDIPMHAYIIDRPWAIGPYGYSNFEWDPERFPNGPAMLGWMNKKGVNPIVWIAPWVMGDPAKEALEKGFELKGQTSNFPERVLIDFTNPKAVEWWQQVGPGRMLAEGVKGFKMDRSEELVPADYEHRAFDGRLSREYRNDYPVMYAKAANEVARKMRGDDFVLAPRAGYTHSSRYAGFWGGDTGFLGGGQKCRPEALRAAIIELLRSAVMGFPIWGSDTGGYILVVDHEVLGRWLGFSCFSPIMEVGPTEDKGLWDLNEEPKYDTQLIAIWRLYAKIHDSLKDYTYDCAKEAAQTGMPIARPLFLICPDQKEAWEDWQTYMFGPDILVSPIWQKGKTSHKLYLPGGEKWVDAWDREKTYDGGQYVTVDAPLYKIPIFIRDGSKIDLGDLNALYAESLKRAGQRPDLEQLQNKEFSKGD
jgi:alpha-D-xyloside xylohydrolase